MKDNDKQKAAQEFADKWHGRGDEKQDTQSFWIELFQKVFGVADAIDEFKFEYRVKRESMSGKRDKTTNFIDALVPKTKVLIEQKSNDVDLDEEYQQSDKQALTPFAQAMQYNAWLPADLRAKWIVVCNFEEFRIHDLNDPMADPAVVKLADLADKFHAFDFMVDETVDTVTVEEQISVQAGELVGKLYDCFLAQYPEEDRDTPEVLKDINRLCVRIVFCLYAEDSGIFKYGQFRDYLKESRIDSMHEDLQRLFATLNTPHDKRARFLKQSLKDFPYVNGGLFADTIEVPPFDETMREFLLADASAGFNWRDISPTIFGAVFESTLNPETRRQGGMHYTSIENIGKVIRPLFLDALEHEFELLKRSGASKTKLLDFQDKLSKLRFLDPACGSGNFLTETFLHLRTMENEIIELLYGGQQSFDVEGLTSIKVSIGQFYGIEINDFAISVAQTALWIAEHQMMLKVSQYIREDFLPLHTKANLVEGNALRLDWAEVIPVDELDYIMGNPPFLGYAYQNKEQKEDLKIAYPETGKNVDYVAGWYYKAAQYVNDKVEIALVSTNSITQGEQVTTVWKDLIQKFGLHINFCHRTFIWNNDSTSQGMAHVHCVIVGCAKTARKDKIIFQGEEVDKVKNINAYLADGPNVFIERRTTPLSDVPEMHRGCQATDDGNFFLEDEDRQVLIDIYPQIEPYIRPFLTAKAFIQRSHKYCLWLDGAPPEIWTLPHVKQRIERVKEFRLQSTKAATREKAKYPMLFDEIQDCKTKYVAIPRVSSENRRYVPIDYIDSKVIPGDHVFCVEDAGLFHFGVLTSLAHNAWMRVVAGRLEMRYRYSNTIVYNNFVWPTVSDKQREAIEKTAQTILDVRAKYPDSSLATLYSETTMPPDLRKAHEANDKAVLNAYGLKKNVSEDAIVSHLMKLYVAKVAEVEKIEAVDAAVQKVIGKKAESVPEWMQELRQQCLDGKLTTDGLIDAGKAKIKELKKAAKAAAA